MDLSVVIPCLNEADTLAACLRKAQSGLQEAGMKGEIIVADNGSTDDSVAIAKKAGARVVPVSAMGYGAALMGGIAASGGQYILMGDADDSYDFSEIPKFTRQITQGYDLVQGCRLPSGGGKIAPGAMPWSHRWIGNPLFSLLVRSWFHAPIHDVYCGMRCFTRELYDSLDQQCTGMEFATEMIIKASLAKARISEVPITLHQDGRISHPPHLKTFRDGWRTLRFYLLFSPRWLFLIPGLFLFFLGLACYLLGFPGVQLGSVTFDVHTLLYGTVMLISGYQSILFAVMTKTFAINHRLLPPDPRFERWFRFFNLETGAVLGLSAFFSGLALLLYGVWTWSSLHFGAMDYPHTLRIAIPGAALVSLGLQTVLFGFFISILGLRKK
jgi:glycosyltransferase involved in cell wall biosynthesis